MDMEKERRERERKKDRERQRERERQTNTKTQSDKKKDTYYTESSEYVKGDYTTWGDECKQLRKHTALPVLKLGSKVHPGNEEGRPPLIISK